jgi:hypothetical protein
MALVYTLFYRRGSFARSEMFGSLTGAMDGAYALFNLEGYSAFSIEDGGGMVMENSKIQEHCRATKANLLRGHPPFRAN